MVLATGSGFIGVIFLDHRTLFFLDAEPLYSYMAVAGIDTQGVARQQQRRLGRISGAEILKRTSSVITVSRSSSVRGTGPS
jgi:hypothetical protein